MKLLTPTLLSPPDTCPYLPDRDFTQEYFWAVSVSEAEMEMLLSTGWRRFGRYFFRPKCAFCRACMPLRLNVSTLSPSKSQQRVLRRCRDFQMRPMESLPTDTLWKMFQHHTMHQFGRQADWDQFESLFLDISAPIFFTEYRLYDRLAAVGFLIRSTESLNSVYFIFDPDYAKYSPGTLSVFREAELARSFGLTWYHLGYWVKDSPRMDYKARFKPHQLYDWQTDKWRDAI